MGRIIHIAFVAWLLNTASASEITQWSKTDSNFNFHLMCERYAEHLIQRSTNLIEWTTILHSFGATTDRLLQISSSNEPHAVFFRAARATEPYGYAVGRYGIVAKQTILLHGVPFVDSFDSSDPQYSTNGRWDPNKRKDRVSVASLSSATLAIDGPFTKIYGSVATGPGGTVTGTIGDEAWCSTQIGIQPGHFTDDLVGTMSDVKLPPDFSSTPKTVPLLGFSLPVTDPRHAFTYVLSPGDWKFGSMNFSSNGVYIEGTVRIWIDGDFRTSGTASVTLAPGATVEIYIGHPASSYSVLMDLSGNCVNNPSGLAANCSIFGLPNCTSMKYSPVSETYCRFYAPQADIRIAGDYDFSGSVIGKYVRFSGTMAIHYDEALGR